jgi:hypothetical protein
MTGKRLTTSEFIERSNKIHHNRYDYSKVKYINNRTKVCIICAEHGEFWQPAHIHLKGRGCRKCGIIDRTNKFIKLASLIHKNKYDYSKSVYNHWQSKIEIICKKHGKFYQNPSQHLSGSNCPKCARESRRNGVEEFIKSSKKIHKNKYDYSKVNYIGNKIKVKIFCPLHGFFSQRPNDHMMGRGCSKCSNSCKSNTKDFIKKSKLIHGNKYNYSKVNYKNAYTPVILICKKHGEFLQKPNGHLSKEGCRKCAYEKNLCYSVSKNETEFLNYNDIKIRSKYIRGYYVDGYDEKTNTIYEFLGDYWHGNPEKFDLNKLHVQLNKTFGMLYEETFTRFSHLKKGGYTIKYIWENDWNKFINGIDKVQKIQTY